MTATQVAGLESALLLSGALSKDTRAMAARRAVDAELVRHLRVHKFAGPNFEKFAERLMRYGSGVMLSWTGTGEIFRQAKAAGRPIRSDRIVTTWDRDDRQQVADDSALAGFGLFKEYGLIRGTWRPDGGASLTTYYMNAVIRAFPQVYNRWHREWTTAQALRASLSRSDEDELIGIPDQRAVDPYHAVATRDELRRLMDAVPDPQTREAITWLAMGYTQDEAAQRTGLPSAKAVERRLNRARRTWRESARTLELGEGEVR